MRVDDFTDLFASAGPFRYRCKLCDRELFGQSRRRHVQRVHKGLLAFGLVTHTRGKWNVTIRAIIETAPAREARAQRREQRVQRALKTLQQEGLR